jgi:hypothetical protein
MRCQLAHDVANPKKRFMLVRAAGRCECFGASDRRETVARVFFTARITVAVYDAKIVS